MVEKSCKPKGNANHNMHIRFYTLEKTDPQGCVGSKVVSKYFKNIMDFQRAKVSHVLDAFGY
jgi:hypothetical protein